MNMLLSTVLLAWPRILYIQFVIVLKKSFHPAFNISVCNLLKFISNIHRLRINIVYFFIVISNNNYVMCVCV